jgi:hypothetical protein
MSHQFNLFGTKKATPATVAPAKVGGPVPIALSELRHVAGGAVACAPGKNW